MNDGTAIAIALAFVLCVLFFLSVHFLVWLIGSMAGFLAAALVVVQ